jgi:hypothetical protein
MKPKTKNERTPGPVSAPPGGAGTAPAASRWSRAKLARMAVWAGLLIGWFALALYCIHRTPDLRLHHDAAAHIEYSTLIAAEHKLPEPHRALETAQPPLFYVLCQLLQPLPRVSAANQSSARPVVVHLTDRTQFEVRGADLQNIVQHLLQRHIPRVRVMCAVFGAVFLASCVLMMHRCKAAGWGGMVALAYLSTLPSVVLLFTSYSNDALAGMFGGGLAIALHASYVSKPSVWRWLAIAICLAGGIYTKFSVGIAGIVACAGIALLLALKRVSFGKATFIGSALACGGLSLFGWMLLHNRPLTGQLLPNNATDPSLWSKSEIFAAGSLKNTQEKLLFFFTPPGITDGEWTDPYIQDQRTYHTKRNLLSHMLVTSAFDEFIYGPSPSVVNRCAWITLWTQVAILIIALAGIRQGPRYPWILLAAALCVQVMILLSYPELHHTNFRLYPWVGMAVAVLISTKLQWSWRAIPPPLPRLGYLAVVLVGIAAHIGMIVSIM